MRICVPITQAMLDYVGNNAEAAAGILMTFKDWPRNDPELPDAACGTTMIITALETVWNIVDKKGVKGRQQQPCPKFVEANVAIATKDLLKACLSLGFLRPHYAGWFQPSPPVPVAANATSPAELIYARYIMLTE